MNNKVWSPLQVYIGSFLSGPFGGCYFLGKNYDTLGRSDLAKRSYLIGIACSLILLLAIILLPEDFFEKIPRMIIPISYSSCIMSVANSDQKKNMDAMLKEGEANRHSYLWCFLLGLALLVVQLPLIFLLFIFFD